MHSFLFYLNRLKISEDKIKTLNITFNIIQFLFCLTQILIHDVAFAHFLCFTVWRKRVDSMGGVLLQQITARPLSHDIDERSILTGSISTLMSPVPGLHSSSSLPHSALYPLPLETSCLIVTMVSEKPGGMDIESGM